MSPTPVPRRRRTPSLRLTGAAGLLGLLAPLLGALGPLGPVTVARAATPAARAAVATATTVGSATTVGGAYVPVPPRRVMDTRTGTGRPDPGAVGPQAVVTTTLAGTGDLPPAARLRAVVLNLTVTNPSTGGYVTAYPADVPRPGTSSVNFPAHWTGAALVTVAVHADGAVAFFNFAGSTDVVVDVVGYYAADDPGAGFGGYTPAAPERLYDSRLDLEAGGQPLGGTASVVLGHDFGAGPDADVTAWVLNLTAAAPTAEGYFTAWSGDGAQPATSSLNFHRGVDVANLAVVRRGTSYGLLPTFRVDVRSPGSAHLVVDLVGTMRRAGTGTDARFVPLASPARLVDTRLAGKGAPGLAPGEVRRVGADALAGTGPTAVALAATVTLVSPSAATYLTLWPSDGPRPTASTLNAGAGRVVANGAVVGLSRLGTAQAPGFSVANFAGTTGVVIDVAGTFVTP